MNREDPWCNSMALLSRDLLVVVDWYNHTVKLIDVGQPMALHTLRVNTMPTSVCSLPETRAAVTLPHEKSILIIDCHNTLSVLNTIPAHGMCWDISYCNTHLIVLYNNPCKVKILHLGGGVVRHNELQISTNILINHLSVMTDGNVTSIFVSDNDKSRILRLDEDLREQQVYPLPDGVEPECVLAVGEGQLLMWCPGGRLWQLDTTMGRFTLLGEGLGITGSMAFCHERQVLYCGFWLENRYAIS